MKRQGEVCALITEGLPAISKEIWVSEPDKDMSRDAIAFACCLSLSSNPAALVLSPLVSIYTGWEDVTRLHSLCSLVLDKFLSSTFQAFLSCFLCFLLFYFPMFFLFIPLLLEFLDPISFLVLVYVFLLFCFSSTDFFPLCFSLTYYCFWFWCISYFIPLPCFLFNLLSFPSCVAIFTLDIFSSCFISFFLLCSFHSLPKTFIPLFFCLYFSCHLFSFI